MDEISEHKIRKDIKRSMKKRKYDLFFWNHVFTFIAFFFAWLYVVIEVDTIWIRWVFLLLGSSVLLYILQKHIVKKFS